MWLHAGPLLMRVFLFSAGVLVWYNTRDTFAVLSRAGLGDRLPLRRQPPARGRQPARQGQRLPPARRLHGRAVPARQVLQGVHVDKLRGGASTEADSNVLVTYALANFLYAFLRRRGHRHDRRPSSSPSCRSAAATIIVALVLAGYLLMRTVKRFRQDLDAPTSARCSSTAGAGARCRPRAARPSRSSRRAAAPRSTCARAIVAEPAAAAVPALPVRGGRHTSTSIRAIARSSPPTSPASSRRSTSPAASR